MRLKYHERRRSILHNPDGSLIGEAGRNVYITPEYSHLKKDCSARADLDSSLVCDKPLRRLVFSKVEPGPDTVGTALKVGLEGDEPEKIWPESWAGQWEVPFVTGASYNMFWRVAQDWKEMTI